MCAAYLIYVAWPHPIDNSQLSAAGHETLNRMRALASASPTPRIFVAPRRWVRPRLPNDVSALGRLAAAGDANAQCALGIDYERGDVVARNYRTARRFFIVAAVKHNGCAINGLGNLYAMGWGVPTDYDAAFSYYKAGAAVGYPGSFFNIGRVYENGWGVMPNDRLAFQWYVKAADAGYPDAFDSVADYYTSGAGGVADRFLAEQYYALAAMTGDTYAIENLALQYLDDETLPDHLRLALHWLTVDAKSPFSQYEIGWMYENGKGVPKDFVRAAHWYKLAADRHYAQAETAYARLLRDGRGGKSDAAGAATYYAAAANAGDPTAMYELGMMAQAGNGAPRNQPLAERLFLAAAMRGNPDALLLLAYRYHNGAHGYPLDLARAQALAMVAGEHGASAKQVMLLAPARSTVSGSEVYSLMLAYDRTIAGITGDTRRFGKAGTMPDMPSDSH